MLHKRLILAGFTFIVGILLFGTLLHWRYRESCRKIQHARQFDTSKVTAKINSGELNNITKLLHDFFVLRPRLLYIGIYNARQQPVYQKTRLTRSQTRRIADFGASYRLHSNEKKAFKNELKQDGFIYRISLDDKQYARVFYLYDDRIYTDKQTIMLRQFILLSLILAGFSILIPLLLSVMRKVTAPGGTAEIEPTLPTGKQEQSSAQSETDERFISIEVENPLIDEEKTDKTAEPVVPEELDKLLSDTEQPKKSDETGEKQVDVDTIKTNDDQAGHTGDEISQASDNPEPALPEGKGLFSRDQLEKIQVEALPEISTLILFDIDYTRQLGIRYGQIKSEMIISETGSVIGDSLPQNGKVFKYSDQQYAVLLPGTAATQSFEIADDIRKEIQEKIFQLGDNDTARATVSGGIASLRQDSDELQSIAETIERARRSLSNAKKNGRNLISEEVNEQR